MNKIAIIAGLGNPGKKYARNRHTVGFMALDVLAVDINISLSLTKWDAEYAKKSPATDQISNGDLVLLKPQSFMNLSGKSVAGATRFFKVPAKHLLVVHDEIELPFGEIRLKEGGGHKGHNGLRDIIEKCGSADFYRLRIGVGRPEHPDVAGYLLSDFSHEEQMELPDIFTKCSKILQEWLQKALGDDRSIAYPADINK